VIEHYEYLIQLVDHLEIENRKLIKKFFSLPLKTDRFVEINRRNLDFSFLSFDVSSLILTEPLCHIIIIIIIYDTVITINGTRYKEINRK